MATSSLLLANKATLNLSCCLELGFCQLEVSLYGNTKEIKHEFDKQYSNLNLKLIKKRTFLLVTSRSVSSLLAVSLVVWSALRVLLGQNTKVG